MKTGKNKRKLFVTGSILAAVLIAGSSLSALAEESTTENTAAPASYSYRSGQQQSQNRQGLFDEAAALTTDAERDAFFTENEIGGGAYSDAQHLDAEALVTAGVIDQATADAITAYASEKHDAIHSAYESKSDLTPDERHAFFDSLQKDDFDGDSVDELLDAGILTEEQAAAIHALSAS